MFRKAFILTCDESSERAQFSKNVLEKVGFDVEFFKAISHIDKVYSNKISMMTIYETIYNRKYDWAYVFEDDINVLVDIKLDEIIKYEEISSPFFYLGICEIDNKTVIENEATINGHVVKIVNGNIRGLHAIGISKEGAFELYQHASKSKHSYMDMCLEEFSIKYPANVVRYDLQSYIHGHRGAFFQDRQRFPSTI